MECKRDPQLSGNALENINEIFKVNGEKNMMEFIEEADKYLDSLNESQVKEVKIEITKFATWLSNNLNKSSKSVSMTLKRKRSSGGKVSKASSQMYNQMFARRQGATKPSAVKKGGAWQPPMGPGGPPMGPPGPPMPMGPQGPGVVRGVIRVGATFLSPRSTTGLIYASIWLAIILFAGFAEQQQHDFFMLGIEQIMSGTCMGSTGYFDIARHPLCTKWRELWVPTLTAINEVFKFNPRAIAVVSAGLGVAVTVPLLIDATIYEIAYHFDYIITTALQSFSGRPLIPPTRSATRPSLPSLMGRFLSLINPLQTGFLTTGQQPNMSIPMGAEYFAPQGYVQPMYNPQAAFAPQGYPPQGSFAQPMYPPQGSFAQPMYPPQGSFAQPMYPPQGSFAQPGTQPGYGQPYMNQGYMQYGQQPQQAWDPRMAQEMPMNYRRRPPVSARSISPVRSHGSTARNDDNRSRNRSRHRSRSRGRSRSRSRTRRNYNRGANY